MKKPICLALFAVIGCCALGQTVPDEHEWKATLKVTDENGTPVVDASVKIAYYVKNTSVDIDGTTDTNGVFVASRATSTSNYVEYTLAFTIDKDGYYETRSKCDLGIPYNAAKWNPLLTLALKPIGEPIPMYARKAQIEIPAIDKAIGFDLFKYDWVAPYGNGLQSDVVFEAHRQWTSRRDFDLSLKMTFPNAGDGFMAVPVLSGQPSMGPRLPVTAPSSGYVGELKRELIATPTEGLKDNNTNQNSYLRIRSVLDTQGNVISALYGKIYGDITLDPINSKTTWILFTYYMNPTPNSHNTEFDSNRNLFGIIPALQQVKDP